MVRVQGAGLKVLTEIWSREVLLIGWSADHAGCSFGGLSPGPALNGMACMERPQPIGAIH